MPRANNRNTKVSGENEISHKCAGTESIQIGNNDLYGQHGSPVLSSENGEQKKPGISHHHQRNLRLPLAPQDHHYCRVPTKGIEWRSR